MLKFLHNRRNKEQALEVLAEEDFKRKTFSFYRYVKIEDPEALRDELYEKWAGFGCLGRIYVAKEGINAQMNVPEPVWDEFVKDLYNYTEFKDVPFKHAVEDPTDSFWKLIIKAKHRILADGIDDPTFDAGDVGEHLDARQFNELLDQEDSVCVDMRNFYESEVGHFDGAITPEASTFREELPMAKEALKGKEDKPVLLYCTGGIRCEKASSYLRHHGFNKVYQLHGGIIQYAHEIEQQGLESKFKGKNFVFDERVGERITDDVISTCHICGDSCDTHENCANKACNLLFIQCKNCALTLKGCCSDECKGIVILPEAEQKEASKTFKKEDSLALGKNPYRKNIYKKETIKK